MVSEGRGAGRKVDRGCEAGGRPLSGQPGRSCLLGPSPLLWRPLALVAVGVSAAVFYGRLGAWG